MANRHRCSLNVLGRAGSPFVALLATMLILELVVAPMVSSQPAGIEKSQANYNSNNLDSIISELIDDASQRLKKSKVGRHLKSSLRFGRRSDPYFAPNELDELARDADLYQVPVALD